MLDLNQVTQDIESWITDFVEVPHPALGGWPPCPYAKKARLEKDFTVRVGMDPYFDLVNLARDGLGSKSVAPLEGELETKHQSFNQFVAGDIQHALFRDWPDQF